MTNRMIRFGLIFASIDRRSSNIYSEIKYHSTMNDVRQVNDVWFDPSCENILVSRSRTLTRIDTSRKRTERFRLTIFLDTMIDCHVLWRNEIDLSCYNWSCIRLKKISRRCQLTERWDDKSNLNSIDWVSHLVIFLVRSSIFDWKIESPSSLCCRSIVAVKCLMTVFSWPMRVTNIVLRIRSNFRINIDFNRTKIKFRLNFQTLNFFVVTIIFVVVVVAVILVVVVFLVFIIILLLVFIAYTEFVSFNTHKQFTFSFRLQSNEITRIENSLTASLSVFVTQ